MAGHEAFALVSLERRGRTAEYSMRVGYQAQPGVGSDMEVSGAAGRLKEMVLESQGAEARLGRPWILYSCQVHQFLPCFSVSPLFA